MLLTSIILVLREVLEAVLLLGILLVLTRNLRLGLSWFLAGLAAGVGGAIGYGIGMPFFSSLFDGIGQEVLNAIMHGFIYLGVFCVAWQLLTYRDSHHRWLAPVMTLVMSLAIIREGSEIFIYLYGFTHSPELLQSVLVGAMFGAGIGLSAGALFYYFLLSFSLTRFQVIGSILLTLVGAGMCLQASQLLIQADLLPGQYPAWDSDFLIAENSITGQVLYALLGYESQPTPVQLCFYFGAILLMAAGLVLAWRKRHHA